MISFYLCFSRRFLFSDGQSFSEYKTLQNVRFEWSVACRLFSRVVPIRTQAKKFKDVFLVKTAST